MDEAVYPILSTLCSGTLAKIAETVLSNSSEAHCALLLSHVCLCNAIDCSQSGPSNRGIFPARVLEWVAIPFSRGPSQASDRAHISGISCVGR